MSALDLDFPFPLFLQRKKYRVESGGREGGGAKYEGEGIFVIGGETRAVGMGRGSLGGRSRWILIPNG